MSDTNTMNETTEAPAKEKKKPGRKPGKKRAFPRARIEGKATALAPAPFDGISANECCDGCNADKCEISGSFYCAHPFKGGLQAAQMNDPEALRRFNRAKAVLKNQMIDLRGR